MACENRLIGNRRSGNELTSSDVALCSFDGKECLALETNQRFALPADWQTSPFFWYYFQKVMAIDQKEQIIAITLYCPLNGKIEILLYSTQGKFLSKTSSEEIIKGYRFDQRLLDLKKRKEVKNQSSFNVIKIFFRSPEQILINYIFQPGAVTASSYKNNLSRPKSTLLLLDLKSGKIISQITLPETDRLFYFKDNYLYGYTEDENDEVVLVKYRLQD